jgi:hypothetical protein
MLISAVAIAGTGVRITYPKAKIDAITLALLAIALVPWLGEVLESFEGPLRLLWGRAAIRTPGR